jgi:PPK2 family polyphosphate:nucleotide phosphotransferase
LLLIFQALDASGKDSCIRHVLAGLDPQGVQCHGFKVPSEEERAHDFLWRHAQALPSKGCIGVHNRSHYEEVLVVKVHPEFVLAQRLAGIRSVKDIDGTFWEERYRSIRAFETHLAGQGTTIMKFHLRMTKKTQRERFLERLDDPKKTWKFSLGDVREHEHWDHYMLAYETAIAATAAPHAPWYVVPADEQWESRAVVARLVREQLERMDPRFPVPGPKQKVDLEEGRRSLREPKD